MYGKCGGREVYENFTATALITSDVKRTSNLGISKYMFECEFGILTFAIRIQLALKQMWH